MTDERQSPTAYPEVNHVLTKLVEQVRMILGECFYGMYLYGSLASGDFDARRSDIDFLVVTDGWLRREIIEALREMHARLDASGDKWMKKLEGAYVPKHLLGSYDPQAPDVPQVNEGKFYQAALGSDWVIQFHTLREQPLVVAGPNLSELIEPVGAEALREAVIKVLDEWWAPMLADPSRLQCSDYQAYAVLTMCRALYTLQEGGVVSKSTAAGWARQTLDGKWHGLIDWAVEWPADQSDHLAEVMALVSYTLEMRGKEKAAPE